MKTLSRKAIRKTLADVEEFAVIQVHWGDAFGVTEGWVDPADLQDTPMQCLSVGLFLRLSKEALILAGTAAENELVANPLIVPLGWIYDLRVAS